jgi:DNA polymerase type B, organellar and viral
LNNSFITLDIETYVKDNILIPFCISIFDGEKVKSFFLSDFKNTEDMILTALASIMIRKYNGYKIYVHNLAKFDVIFLLKYLVKLGIVQPVIHNDRIISINFNFGVDNKYSLQFRDSYLILLSSLNKLCKSFKVETLKSVFPYLFVNENNFNYIGVVPDFKYFDNKITLEEYNEYKSKFNDNNWNLKSEVIEYCCKDSIGLHEVIFKFAEMIFSLFQRNIHHYPTLPSLAFAIFRSKFMSKDIIPQLSGQIASDIRESYTRGSVDMFIPENKTNKLIYAYDVNSLYPAVMENNLMPVGTPIYFKGNIRLLDENAFGFFFCEIVTPNKLKHPILQTHVKTSNGIRTISPLGSRTGRIFSAEMDNAIKLGYKINILWGYTFSLVNIFKEYVDTLYGLRLNYPKSDPMNYIAKILLNSLYGRFGMDDNFSNVNIIHKDYYSDFENKYLDNILDTKELGDYKLVTFESNQMLNDDVTHNISIGVASAITAYARIHLSQFKNNPQINLYYTDTDSIYLEKPLNSTFISETVLGKLKLENICTKAIFLSPKVYCLLTESDQFIYKVKGLSHEVELTMDEFVYSLKVCSNLLYLYIL